MAASPEVVVIGSGMGGGTVAWALAQRGIDTVLLERGGRLPREPENWSPEAVFQHRRYQPDEWWYDAAGRAFRPGIHAVVGGSTKVYGASLPRFRESDFVAVEHPDGTSRPGRSATPTSSPTTGRPSGSTGCTAAPGRTRPSPGAARRTPPGAAARPLHRRPPRPAAGRRRPSQRQRDGHRLGGRLRALPHLRRLPVPGRREVGRRDLRGRPGGGDRPRHPAHRTTARRLVTRNGRVTAVEADGPDGPLTLRADRFVLAAGAVLSAAFLLGHRGEEHPDGLANSSRLVGRHFMMHNNAHVAAADVRRRNDAVFQKTLSVNDWYHDAGDGFPGGTLQLIGTVQASMMKSWATRVPMAVLGPFAARSVEWLVMGEDLPDPENRVLLGAAGRVTTVRRARNTASHARLLRRAKRLLR
ncbi:MAG: NAD(P)-binding protein [Nocardioides sp.]